MLLPNLNVADAYKRKISYQWPDVNCSKCTDSGTTLTL